MSNIDLVGKKAWQEIETALNFIFKENAIKINSVLTINMGRGKFTNGRAEASDTYAGYVNYKGKGSRTTKTK